MKNADELTAYYFMGGFSVLVGMYEPDAEFVSEGETVEWEEVVAGAKAFARVSIGADEHGYPSQKTIFWAAALATLEGRLYSMEQAACDPETRAAVDHPKPEWWESIQLNVGLTMVLESGGDANAAVSNVLKHSNWEGNYATGRVFRPGRLETSPQSVVKMVCPSAAKAMEHPEATKSMYDVAITVHSVRSDYTGWRDLRKTMLAVRDAWESG